MTENLEEKYKYMCKMVEQLSTTLGRAENLIAENKDLKDYIDNICGIIDAEMPLRYQDEWLEKCIKRGFYKQ
tara:strand:+ start:232 stop:447 length:216 start_codon:yes stop_codon:yes gene_type:complete